MDQDLLGGFGLSVLAGSFDELAVDKGGSGADQATQYEEDSAVSPWSGGWRKCISIRSPHRLHTVSIRPQRV